MLSTQQSLTVIVAGLLAATLGTSVARAETSCKGLVADQCGSRSECSWVKGYTRKDGKTVDGYCRNKGARSKLMSERGAVGDPATKAPVRSHATVGAAKSKQDG